MYKHILVPTDGSDLSRSAVRHGIALAKQSGAKLTFLNVVMPFHVVAGDVGMMTDTRASYEKHARQRAERVLAECEQAARDAGVRSEGRFTFNERPYEDIVKAAEDADLVVMASHARRGLEGLLLGSQTHRTITHGRTPVLVVR